MSKATKGVRMKVQMNFTPTFELILDYEEGSIELFCHWADVGNEQIFSYSLDEQGNVENYRPISNSSYNPLVRSMQTVMDFFIADEQEKNVPGDKQLVKYTLHELGFRVPDINGYYECDNYESCKRLVDEHKYEWDELDSVDAMVLCDKCIEEERAERLADARDWYYGK